MDPLQISIVVGVVTWLTYMAYMFFMFEFVLGKK